MCTAVTYKTKDFYFGRTLDNPFSYQEEITITPRCYPFHFRRAGKLDQHYAMIGMAYVVEDYPLYYDAVNEKGLGIAGLNFVGNAVYREAEPNKDNVAQFELIPWLLAQCASVEGARLFLEKINITNDSFNPSLPAAQLHWIIADCNSSIVVESVQDGIKIYDNPAGILTNNPLFYEQMFHLNNYMMLSPKKKQNLFSDKLNLYSYCHGMGAIGLPGDLSSQSRFVRAAFVKLNSVSGDSEEESVSQFFHILNSVDQPRGCCDLGDGEYETTIYTSCCNAQKGIYYYTTYGNHQITAVSMFKEKLEGRKLIKYPLVTGEKIFCQN